MASKNAQTRTICLSSVRGPEVLMHKGADTDIVLKDQHASDEKYNFETLQATTKILGQRLIV